MNSPIKSPTEDPSLSTTYHRQANSYINTLVESVFEVPSATTIPPEAKIDIESKVKEIIQLLVHHQVKKGSEAKDGAELEDTEQENILFEIASLREENEQLNEMSINLISQIGKLKKYLDDSELVISLLRGELSQFKRDNKIMTQALKDVAEGKDQAAFKILEDLQNRKDSQSENQYMSRKSCVLPMKRNSLNDELRLVQYREEADEVVENSAITQEKGMGEGNLNIEESPLGERPGIYLGHPVRKFQTLPNSFGYKIEESASASNKDEEPQNSVVTGEEDQSISPSPDEYKGIMNGANITFNENLIESQYVPKSRLSHFPAGLQKSPDEREELDLKESEIKKPFGFEGIRATYSIAKSPLEVTTERKAREQKLNDYFSNIGAAQSEVFKKKDSIAMNVNMSPGNDSGEAPEGLTSISRGSRAITPRYRKVNLVSKETQTDEMEVKNIELSGERKISSKKATVGLTLGGLIVVLCLLKKDRISSAVNYLFKK